jgi:hypothetical protein
VTAPHGGKWRKSSYSGGTGGDCVELMLDEQGLLVRDSKAPLGGTLSFADPSASAFLSAVKAGLYQR